jgi:hypothetical protein
MHSILTSRLKNIFELVNFDIFVSDSCLSYATRFQKFCFVQLPLIFFFFFDRSYCIISVHVGMNISGANRTHLALTFI